MKESESLTYSLPGIGQRLFGGGAKVVGIFGLLVVICLYTTASSEHFLNPVNLQNVVHRTALFGILGVGVAFVIITGGIDLSIGSLVCLVGVLLPYLLTEHDWSIPGAVTAVMGLSVLIGFLRL